MEEMEKGACVASDGYAGAGDSSRMRDSFRGPAGKGSRARTESGGDCTGREGRRSAGNIGGRGRTR